MSTTTNWLGKQAKTVNQDVQKVGGAIRDATQAQIDQVGEKAAEYYEEVRDKARGVTYTCEQFLCERPLSSVLMAVGIGWLLGRFWKRR